MPWEVVKMYNPKRSSKGTIDANPAMITPKNCAFFPFLFLICSSHGEPDEPDKLRELRTRISKVKDLSPKLIIDEPKSL